MNEAREERTCREHDRFGFETDANLRQHARHRIAVECQVVDRLLKKRQPWLILEPRSDRVPIEQPVGLRAGRAHRGSLARIEDAKLDPGLVGSQRHRTAQGVDFLDQVALADTPDGRIA